VRRFAALSPYPAVYLIALYGAYLAARREVDAHLPPLYADRQLGAASGYLALFGAGALITFCLALPLLKSRIASAATISILRFSVVAGFLSLFATALGFALAALAGRFAPNGLDVLLLFGSVVAGPAAGIAASRRLLSPAG
jgi:hypothetical protein